MWMMLLAIGLMVSGLFWSIVAWKMNRQVLEVDRWMYDQCFENAVEITDLYREVEKIKSGDKE